MWIFRGHVTVAEAASELSFPIKQDFAVPQCPVISLFPAWCVHEGLGETQPLWCSLLAAIPSCFDVKACQEIGQVFTLKL